MLVEEKKINIGTKVIGGSRSYIIAEIGNNHNGCFKRAIEMIDLCSEIGVDCVKFQLRNLNDLYRQKTLLRSGEDLGTEYVLDLLQKYELDFSSHDKLRKYCEKIGVQYLCTPWDIDSVKKLAAMNLPAYKIASADLTNIPLIKSVASLGMPMLLSTGMSSSDEIEKTVNFLNTKRCQFVLLHCISSYPAPLQDLNLAWIEELKKLHPLVGYSGHERGINASLAARALGACVIERHFTLDRNMEGPDHAASLEPNDFRLLIEGVREIEIAFGFSKTKSLSQGEMINRENLGKSIVAAKPIPAGTIIRDEHVTVKSPGKGLSPQKIEHLIGIKVARELNAEDYFFESDLTGARVTAGDYDYKLRWGIPVRFHDFKFFKSLVQPDLWEFHLSYHDMKLQIENFITEKQDTDFVVHAPELFSDSHLLDLASRDKLYLEKSISEMQRVIDLTRKLNSFFPNTVRPMIVVNVGGFSMDAPMEKKVLSSCYDIFARSLTKLDLNGVELIPQTMAPFPWHFGGQRYQNLFVEIEEILDVCKNLNLRMCFDTSHSKLASNHLGFDFYNFAKRIAPITGHIHVGDAAGINGEGLQIGDGEIDFHRLGKILKSDSAHASFIPEIWQGHNNNGEGFWKALEALKNLL